MKIRLFALLGLAFAASVGCVRADDPPEIADTLQAVVDDTPITRQQVEHVIDLDEQALYEQYRDQPQVFRSRAAKLREDGQELLINREVILQEFKKSIKVPESILDAEVADEIRRKFHGDNVELTKRLEAEGMTKEQYKKQIRDQFIVSAMRDKFIPEPIISPKKIENFYVAHHNDFKVEDQVRLRMIILARHNSDTDLQVQETRKRAQELVLQLKGGATFADLARTYSDGSTAKDGGDTGWEDVSVVNPLLVTELNKLKPGQFSEVIEAPDGFYLVLLEDRHPAHFKTLNEVRAQIEQTLDGTERERLAKQWMQRLKDKTFIERF